MKLKIAKIPIKDLKTNNGQIPGLPKNPRYIKDYRYKQLVNSIRDDPEFLEIRELVVYPFKEQYIVIAGNQRLMALRELNFKDTVCKILPEETPVEKLKAFVIKDNISFGMVDWDLLANEWNETELLTWGIEIPLFNDESIEKMDEKGEYIGMPEFEPGEISFTIRIHFKNQDDRDKFVELTKMEFMKKYEMDGSVWSTWWPFTGRRDMNSLKYEEVNQKGK